MSSTGAAPPGSVHGQPFPLVRCCPNEGHTKQQILEKRVLGVADKRTSRRTRQLGHSSSQRVGQPSWPGRGWSGGTAPGGAVPTRGRCGNGSATLGGAPNPPGLREQCALGQNLDWHPALQQRQRDQSHSAGARCSYTPQRDFASGLYFYFFFFVILFPLQKKI